MAKIEKFCLFIVSFLLLCCPVFATTPCQSGQQTWLYTVDTSNQSHVVACLSEASGVVPWFGYLNTLTSATTLTFDASLGNAQKVTIATNITASTLSNPIVGQWIYFTIVEDAVGGHTFQQPANFVNWQAIDTTANATTTEVGWFDGTYFQVVSAGGGGGGGSCPQGSLFSQYVDSAQGNDSNGGTNWCDAKLTETAGSTGLGGFGGTIREAPNYTGAAATGVPANVNIFRFNQFDTLGSSMQLFAFPDLTTNSENHYSFVANSNGTVADADAAFTEIGAFSATHLITSVLGNLTIPSTSPFRTREQAGLTGIVTNNSATDTYQADGVLGICYNPGSLGLDCTGVVGIAGNGASGESGSMEAMWANLSLASATTDAMGLVIRATGGHMPTTQIGSVSGRPNSAIDIAYGGSGGAADAFPTGIFFENQAAGLTNFAFTGNGTLNNPHTDVYTYDRWWDYYSASVQLDTFSVIKLNNSAISDQGAYQAGNYVFQNSVNTSEVVLPINHTGTVKVEGIKAVTFSATPTFDRAQGSVQTITLTGDVTSSTLQNCVAGQTIIFDIIEDGSGAHTFVAPANLHGFGSITTTANFHNRQMFYCDGSSSNSGGYSVSTMQSGT